MKRGSQARRKLLRKFALTKRNAEKGISRSAEREEGGESWAKPKFTLPLGSSAHSTPQAFEKA